MVLGFGGDTFQAELKRDFVHETSGGREIELRKGERCWVLHQEEKTWQILHNSVNEPVSVPAHYLRKC